MEMLNKERADGTGAPGSIVEERVEQSPLAGKSKLAAELDVVGDPIIYLSHKLIEFFSADGSEPDRL